MRHKKNLYSDKQVTIKRINHTEFIFVKLCKIQINKNKYI